MIAEGDRVAARLTMRGTHLGPLNGVPATGRTVVVSGMSIERVAEGRIVEGRRFKRCGELRGAHLWTVAQAEPVG